ncbi:transcription termination factor NusA [Rhodoflexus caldus]|uniref:transcription termination factor NusA n=1 Tax=Rhodoflexus caldus TaxID=2891236 RepID=UPI002029F4A3|nr:transcription termination factor NusA [Rhodoflexus caldus]
METGLLIESFKEFASQKSIDRPTMVRILEDVFRTMIRKKYLSDENFDVIVNIDKGDLEILHYREVVEDDAPDYDENKQIRLSDARKIDEDFSVGEEVAENIKIEDFGRRVVQTARQTLIQKIKDLEKDNLFNKYKVLVGQIVTCEVYQVLGREVILRDAQGNELVLPRSEQIMKDRFRKGDSVRAIVHRVEMVNGNPRIILSRTSPIFLERLFEQEVPEVYDGIITIRKTVREPGERAKVAVESYDDRIDPVGACVGMKGSRIHSIVRELCNENIDVINYTDNIELFIQRALSPAKISSIKIDEEHSRAAVFLKRDQVSLAIGKGGQNIKLAGKLVGLEIDVFRELTEADEEEEDVELTEFADVLDEWVIEEFTKIGLDTARSVLGMSRDYLIKKTELEEETVDFVLDVLRKEFE